MRILLLILLSPFILLWSLLLRRRDMVFLPEDHPEMKRAIARARASYVEFLETLANPPEGAENFAVKVSFRLDCDSTEHIWVDHLVLVDGELEGKVANDPNDIDDLQLGDPVFVKKQCLSDWAYCMDGYYHGHFTTRALLPHMKKKVRRHVMEMMGWDGEQA